MEHTEFMRFLSFIRQRARRNKDHQLNTMKSEQWEKLRATFDSNLVGEEYFLKMSRREYAKMLDKQLPKGIIIKIKKVLSTELKMVASKRFTSDKQSVAECTAEEVASLLLSVMKDVLKIDIENDVDMVMLKRLFVDNKEDGKVDGKVFCTMDEEYIISNLLLPALQPRFGNLDAHRLGKRYRYWPAYADNCVCDLYNGKTTQKWYAKPKFGDIKDEVLHNPLAKITVNQWNRTVLYASKIVIKTATIKALKATVPVNKKDFGATSNSSFHKYGVKEGDKIRLEHLVPLLLFVDLDFVSKEVIRSSNNNNWRHQSEEDIRKVMEHHVNVAQISRLIRETVECYGQTWGEEEDGITPTFYHLLDKDIVPSSLDLRFFSPMSVTTKLNAALVMNNFNENEVVLQLKHSPNSNLKYFDCSWISEYPLESEHIVCGGLGTATICNIYDLCAGMRFDYHVMAMDLFMAAISRLPIRDIDDQSMNMIAAALSSMMQAQFQQTQRAMNEDEEDDSKSEGEPFIDASFGAMCNVIRYAQLSLSDIKGSPLLSKIFYQGKHGMIKFSTLCGILPNCRRYFVCLRGVDANETEKVLYSEKLIKYLTKTSDGAAGAIQGITFGVEANIKIDLSKFADCGWTASDAPVGGLRFVKLQRNLNQ